MNEPISIPFEQYVPIKDRVTVRRAIGEQKDVAPDSVFAGSDGARIAHAETSEMASGVLVSTAGVRKDRATVVVVGPAAKRLKPGDTVLLPPPNDKQKRFPLMNYNQAGHNWLVYREDDLIMDIKTLPVPESLRSAFA